MTQSNYSVLGETGFTRQAADHLLRKSFSFYLRQIKRDMR